MNIVKQKWIFLNSTLVVVPKQVKKLYIFGIQTLALRRIESLRANARLMNLNWHTAKSKAYRLTNNDHLLPVFKKLLAYQRLIGPKDIIAVDFSDFGNDLQVLMFAKQTRKGRTIPVYFEILKYPIQKDSQNTFIIQAIIHLQQIVGFKPKLVFDRGFACPSIIEYLAQNHWIFYIRIKGGKTVIYRKLKQKAQDLAAGMYQVKAYDRELSLTITPAPQDLKGKAQQPWYIISNDLISSAQTVTRIYYHRFEIEEFFKDAKRYLGLEYINLQKELSLTIALWFVILGLWFVWDLEQKILANDDYEKQQREQRQLSIVRYLYEKLWSEIILAAEGEYLNNTG
jgi:hypothetical protein